MKITKLSVMAVAILSLTQSANATLKTDKVTLKNNMIVSYDKLPTSSGTIYGRLRTNTFYWDWDKEIAGKQKDNKAMGVGASLIYKSASANGFSLTAGLYTSQSPCFYRMDKDEVKYVKAGKDTFSRNEIKNGGSYDGSHSMIVFAQGYLQYDFSKTTLKVGRQLVENVFTKSNDTKMIPNTFDGITLSSKEFANTTLELAYLVKQKLRDHTNAHDVLAYNPRDSWSENDDSSVNRNLTVDRIGTNNRLMIASITNKSIKNLKLNASYLSVPNVLDNLVLEAHYAIPIGGFKIVPGIRYMQQFDKLHASYKVANLKGKHTGYKDATNLDTNLLALRVDMKTNAFLARFGYSKVADKADIVAPWRGFPTGGFTRAMGQYNWYANTEVYMFRVGYDFGKAKILDGFSIMARYAIQDFDDKKDGVQADSNVLHIDMRQNIGKNLQAKIRLGFVDADDGIRKSDGSFKTDVSYSEYRFELNYFF
jgi:hypothetical protein